MPGWRGRLREYRLPGPQPRDGLPALGPAGSRVRATHRARSSPGRDSRCRCRVRCRCRFSSRRSDAAPPRGRSGPAVTPAPPRMAPGRYRWDRTLPSRGSPAPPRSRLPGGAGRGWAGGGAGAGPEPLPAGGPAPRGARAAPGGVPGAGYTPCEARDEGLALGSPGLGRCRTGLGLDAPVEQRGTAGLDWGGSRGVE